MRKLMIWLLVLLMMIPVAASADGALSLSVSNAVENDTLFGRCVVPEGYTVSSSLVTCTLNQSVAYPCQAVISAENEKGSRLVYLSANDFMAGTGPEAVTQDGQFNLDFQTPMLHYMAAGEYCDYIALNLFYPVADNGDLVVAGIKQLPELEAAYAQMMEPEVARWKRELGGIIAGVDETRTSMCMKAYQFSMNGEVYYGIVLTGNVGVWITVNGLRDTISWVNWVVPFTYVLYAPDNDPDAMEAFEMFVMNTTASDQFMKANLDMSAELWKIIKKAHDITDCFDYTSRTIREKTAEGNDYDDDRVSDYIFDRNDYTLSDGSHVKVSTEYSYVWEGDNGTVYAGTRISDQPGGSRQLTPNR